MVSIDSLPTLQIAVFALKTARDTIPTLRSHQERCNHLIERCQRLIVDVCGQLKPNSSPELLRQLQIVERACITVRDTVMNLQNKGTVWRTLNKENVEKAFKAADMELSDAFLVFNVGAHVANNRSQQELATALQNDRQYILRYLDDLLKRSQLLAEAFEKKDNKSALPLAPSTNVTCELSAGDVALESQEDAILGSGTVGKVMRGWLGRRVVAVKQLHPEFSQHLSQNCNKKLLESKFLLWTRLSHPNVTGFLGFLINNEQHFFVGEFCLRSNVLDYLQRYPEANRLLMLHQVCSGMEYLHENMIIHGNLKASNLLVGKDHKVLVADYDLAWLIDDVQVTDSGLTQPTFGTLVYMAPEYLDGGDLEYHVDVYSFAIATWVLHTGRIPFSRVPWRKYRQRVVERRERPQKPDSIHEVLWSAMDKWWSHDPDDRPTFIEMESFLRDLVGADGARPKAGLHRQRSRIKPPEIVITQSCTSPMTPTSPAQALDFGITIPISESGKKALADTIYALDSFASVDKVIKQVLLCYPNWVKVNKHPRARGPRPDHIYEDGVDGIVNRFKKAMFTWIENIPELQGSNVSNGNRTLLIISATCVMAEYTLHQSSWAPHIHADKFVQDKLATSQLRAFLETATRKIWINHLKSSRKDLILTLETLTQAVEHAVYLISLADSASSYLQIGA